MFEEISREDLQKVINRLDQALYNHQVWFNAIIRTLICRLSPDQHDMSAEPYKECRFGQWYYSESSKDLVGHPGFKALGEEHSRMHQLAKNLLSIIATGGNISPPDYDNFSNALDRLRLEMSTLRRELENIVYNRDALTGAINRVNMLTVLREQQEISKRDNRPCFLVMMDLDHFKKVNDQYGHSAGDHVLSTTVHYVLQNLRPSDKVFRYGGEEFLISLNNMETKAALEWVDNLRKGLSEIDVLQVPTVVHITASFGIAFLDPYLPVEQSIERSDKALLEAKSAGGNCTREWKAG